MIGRVLGEIGLGIYATILAWIFPLSLITEWGLGTLITRDVAQNISLAHGYLEKTMLARLIIGCSLIFFTWIAAPILLNQDAQLIQSLRISTPMILILPMYSAFTAIFRAHQDMRPVAFLNVGMLTVQVIGTGIIFLNQGTILNALAWNTITSAGQLLAAWGVYRNQFYVPTDEHLIPSSMFVLLKLALPFAIAAVLSAFYMRLTFILLELFASAAAVGFYAAAYRFIEAGRMLPHALFDALFPRLASLVSDRYAFNQLFYRVSMILAIFGVLFGMSVSIAASTIIQITYGSVFVQSAHVLKLLAWGLLPMVLRQLCVLYLYAMSGESLVNLVFIAGLAAKIVFCFVFIPRFGVMGAAWVFILIEISMLIALSMLIILSRR